MVLHVIETLEDSPGAWYYNPVAVASLVVLCYGTWLLIRDLKRD